MKEDEKKKEKESKKLLLVMKTRGYNKKKSEPNTCLPF